MNDDEIEKSNDDDDKWESVLFVECLVFDDLMDIDSSGRVKVLVSIGVREVRLKFVEFYR